MHWIEHVVVVSAPVQRINNSKLSDSEASSCAGAREMLEAVQEERV